MKVRFTAAIELPEGTPIDDAIEWLKYHLGDRDELAAGNSLLEYYPQSCDPFGRLGCSEVTAAEVSPTR